MPKVGLKDFPYTEEGALEAESYSEATGLPVEDARNRMQTYQYGGQVHPMAPTVSEFPEHPMSNVGGIKPPRKTI